MKSESENKSTGATFAVLNPATREEVARVPTAVWRARSEQSKPPTGHFLPGPPCPRAGGPRHFRRRPVWCGSASRTWRER